MSSKSERLSIRLAAEDREWLQSRAEAMGVPEATYLCMLIRQCRSQGVEAVMSLSVPGAVPWSAMAAEEIVQASGPAEETVDPAATEALIAGRLAEAEQAGLTAVRPAAEEANDGEPDGSSIVRSLRPAGGDDRLNISRRKFGR